MNDLYTNTMTRFLAEFHVAHGPGKRTHPIRSGYRPDFDLEGQLAKGITPPTLYCGSITLLDREELFPGETAFVEIRLRNAAVAPQQKISASEGLCIVGYAVVLRVLNQD